MATENAAGDTAALLNVALRDDVGYYGFRHIRFFVVNGPGTVERYRLDAEANAGGHGNWQTFKK